MKKAFDQTVRDLKREVNKKVLKVPGIEQKVLDATSNEPWGPHGTLLAEISQATRNYHEYQMIMQIIWKRISDIGKNWRHVYKGLTVLEYLVANGSERVIDDIREHAYQISALADFQYLDSGGRDQGNNVRRKSQSLVVLVNDKERIAEVRQKASVNREKFRTSSTSGMYRPGSHGDRYDDNRYEGRYGSRDDDMNGYGREREWGSRDGDRYGRNGDSYGREGDRYGRDGYKDDDYRGGSRNTDEYQHGSRSRSSERDREHAYYDDGPYSSRGNAARADDQSPDERAHEQKFSEQNTGAPPSYEEVVAESQSPVHGGRDGESASSSAAKAPTHVSSNSTVEATTFNDDASSAKQGVDEFDPRVSVVAPISAPPVTSINVEMDLLGSLSDSYSSNILAIMPAPSATATSETHAHANFGSGPTYGATASSPNVLNQGFEDPFGGNPFKATPSADSGVPQPQPQPQPPTSVAHFQPTTNQTAERPSAGPPNVEAATNFGFQDSFSATTYPAQGASGVQPPTSSQFSPFESSTPHPDIDSLAGIFPPSAPQPFAPSQAQPNNNYYGGFQPQPGSTAPVAPNMAPHAQTGVVQAHTQNLAGAPLGNYQLLGGSAAPFGGGPPGQHTGDMLGPQTQIASQPTLTSSTGPLSIVAQPPKKFETKSTVWADTLSRGLVDLNISGSKINPLADIGIDFAAINRREKRMEKPTSTPPTSTVTMGQAMGSGSGIGRSGASALRPAPNPMMGSGMGIGRGPSPGMGMGGGYGGMYQPMGGTGMMNPGMAMNMRMGQGVPMQQPPNGLPPGGYNPMMGAGGYASQQPYGGYR